MKIIKNNENYFPPVYVQADPNCNQLTFQLGVAAVGTAIAARQWSIKVDKRISHTAFLLQIFE